MTRFLFCLLICAVAAPVLAEPTDYVRPLPPEAPIGRLTYNAGTGEFASTRDGGGPTFVQYSDTAISGYYWNAARLPGGAAVGDDLHLETFPFPMSITELVFGYSAPAVYNPGIDFGVTVRIIENGPDDSILGATMTMLSVDGLPFGTWIVEIEGLEVPKIGSDLWFIVDYGALVNGGPLITDNPGSGPAYPVGFSHNLVVANGQVFEFDYGAPLWADLYYEVRGVPGPPTICVIASLGLLVLRRRRLDSAGKDL